MSRSVIDQIRDELVAGAERYELRRRRVRGAGVAVLLVVALAAGAVVWNAERSEEAKVLVQPDETSTTTVPSRTLEREPVRELVRLPAAPRGAASLAPVWTGHEFLFVGATDEEGTIAAYSYDVEARAWHDIGIPPSPIGSGSSAVWTGSELVICCGEIPRSNGAAAYNPESHAWRVLPSAPVHGYTTAVWTGTDMVVVAPDGVASFDPGTNKWTSLPMPAEVASFNKSLWTGHDLVIWPAPGSRTTHRGEVFDPDTQKWTTLPAPPEQSWPAMPDIAWIGDSLVVIGGLPAPGATSERMVGARYDPTTNAWTSLPDPLPEPRGAEGNLGSQKTLWTGTYLLTWASSLASGLSADGALLAYDPARNAWKTVGTTKTSALRPLVMAGDRVLLQRDDDYYLSVPAPTPHPERDPTSP